MSPNGISKRPVIEPAPSPRITQAERTRAQILDAAGEFLWSRPFRDMTVNRLMETTALSRAVFYRYFDDIHGLMLALLSRLEADVFEGISPWLSEAGDPVALMHESLAEEVRVCYRYGPFMKAINDAAGGDGQLEDEWHWFFKRFDDAVIDRVVEDQALGLIEAFDPGPIATALNRADAAMYILKFGSRPRSQPGPVLDSISRIWISTLYGPQWAAGRTSTLLRPSAQGAPEQKGSS